jgi:hypothetical protein
LIPSSLTGKNKAGGDEESPARLLLSMTDEKPQMRKMNRGRQNFAACQPAHLYVVLARCDIFRITFLQPY